VPACRGPGRGSFDGCFSGLDASRLKASSGAPFSLTSVSTASKLSFARQAWPARRGSQSIHGRSHHELGSSADAHTRTRPNCWWSFSAEVSCGDTSVGIDCECGSAGPARPTPYLDAFRSQLSSTTLGVGVVKSTCRSMNEPRTDASWPRTALVSGG